MFTGIVQEMGTVQARDAARLSVTVGCAVEPGGSVAVDGVCLTATRRADGLFTADLSEETLARTTLGRRREGDRVNVELPLTPQTPIGGHLVQGHVDGVGEVVRLEPTAGGGADFDVRVPAGLARYLVEKGSVAVDGVSLTVAALAGDVLTAALVPETLSRTTLGARTPGDPVNVEVDLLAKYVERMVSPYLRAQPV